MKVSEAVESRKSVRQFLSDPVDPAVIRAVLSRAARAPSGGNLQPWRVHVLGGESLARFKAIMAARVVEAPAGEQAEYDVYPRELSSPYRDRRYQVGEDLYRSIGVTRDDRPGRLRQFARNYAFFDAPLALFCSVDRQMGAPQWADLGMFLQTVMLLLREAGLHSCTQECWARYPQTVGEFLALPPQRMLFCGMAIGYEDSAAPINQWRAARVPLEDFAQFDGV
ncbi:nitroreductase family protein [Paraburkholderia sp. J12]|uniref:nitroreductase family protein n=1 Tax=Paraburkholderia sp. J12 TaxID=2805432 RepID=UPI002ABDFAED|nr:nitroreductase family protein [Paraburkholderia sp. J12]